MSAYTHDNFPLPFRDVDFFPFKDAFIFILTVFFS